MEITMHKCEKCGQLFDKPGDYDLHMLKEWAIEKFLRRFPIADIEGKGFTQREAAWCVRRQNAIADMVAQFGECGDHVAWTYGWSRCLDDSGSMFYRLCFVEWRTCQKCHKEWPSAHENGKCCRGLAPHKDVRAI